MKIAFRYIAISLSLVGTIVTAPAYAGDPCAAVVCMSNGSNAPHECKDAVDGYFDIRVYRRRHHFDPGATALRRYQAVMDQCPDARQRDKDRINAMFGTLEYSPFTFTVVD